MPFFVYDNVLCTVPLHMHCKTNSHSPVGHYYIVESITPSPFKVKACSCGRYINVIYFTNVEG